MLRSPRALTVFAKILREEKGDVYLIYQVLEAVAKIPDPQVGELLNEATTHPYRLVRERAKKLLQNGNYKSGSVNT